MANGDLPNKPLGTQAAPGSSPVSAMTTGTWQVNTFSFSTCRGDNIVMPSTHRTPEPLASPLSLKTEFPASVDNFEKGGNKTSSSGAGGKWHVTASVVPSVGSVGVSVLTWGN